MASPAQRKIPVGTASGVPATPPPNTPTKATDALKDVPAHIVDGWRRLGANLSDPKVADFYAARYRAMQARRSARMA